MTVPVIALTSGDPAGVGPEVAVKARAQLGTSVPFVWIGDPRHLPPGTTYTAVTSPQAALALPAHHLPVLPHAFALPARPGQPAAENAPATIAVIERATALVQSGAASALCTAPINKSVLKTGAGFAFPGHTEFLAHLAGVDHVVMMLAGDGLRTVPVTIHCALADVPARLTPELLEQTLRITQAGLIHDFGIPHPRLAVAGLNPHAGEAGLMGHEEQTILLPVLDRLRAEGFTLAGPLPADTMFHPAARARYDAAICMYHDQALIPIKTIDFAGGVNVTLGLPFIRTSPDHGTAYDIAGHGIADPSSLIAALRLAQTMAIARAAHQP